MKIKMFNRFGKYISRWLLMNCPKCGKRTEVTRTIIKEGRVFRYRICRACKYRFKTIETVADGWDYKGIVKQIKSLIDPLQI